jgi:predicted TPR repeat methyltransferase
MSVALPELHAPSAPTAPPLAGPPRDELAERLGRWRSAFPALDALILSNTPPAAAMRRLGLTFWAAGQPAAAAEALGDSVALDDRDGAVWLDLGFSRRACGRSSEALEAFERAAELTPGVARVWLAIGLAAKELGAAPRAEAALERAVELDPLLDDAAYALGLICFETRRYAEAAHRWRPLAARGYRAAGLKLGLGQCEFFLGDFAAAAVSLQAHLEIAPGDADIARRLALLRFLNGAIRGGPQAGREAYVRGAAADPAALGEIARVAVSLLSAYGYAQTALSVARAFLADDADDPVGRHQLAALSAEPLARASADFVTTYFDRFADTFDEQLYGVLQYGGPRRLNDLVAATGAPTARTLDLGCGTGAAGALLRPRATRLEGVDLSSRMLDKARARGLYDELAQADMVDWLAGRENAYDLVFVADALIYLGELGPLLAAAAGAIAPGGSLAVTLEPTTRAPYELMPSGRFAHSPRALIAAAAPWFSLRATRRAFLRLEAHRRVYGALVVLERRG